MSALDQGRLLTAEVKWGGDADAIFWVGTAPIHQFWPRLAPQFNAALLAPQRRMDGEVVAWTWRESDRDDAITTAELLALRSLLGTSLESFRKHQPPGNELGTDGAPAKNRSNLGLLWDAVGLMVAGLLAKSDRDLLAFVVRTEAGLRIHSWGAKKAGAALAPEQLGHEVSGIVIAAGKAAEDVEVQMKNASGEIHAKTLSDGTGRFRFSNVGPGSYRLFALSDKSPFPSEGVDVSIETQGVTGLKLRISAGGAEGADSLQASAEPIESPRRRRGIVALLAGAAMLVGAIIYWRQLDGGKAAVAPPLAATPAQAARPRPEQIAASDRRSTTIVTTARMGLKAQPARPEVALHPAAPMDGSHSLRTSISSAPGAVTSAASSSLSSTASIPLAGNSGAQNPSAVSPAASSSVSSPVTAPTSESRQPSQRSHSVPAKSSPIPAEPNDSSAVQNPEPAVADSVQPIPAWAHHNQMTAGTWKIRLLVDPILPTDPTGDASPEALELLRKRVMEEQLSAMPGIFRALRSSRGYSVRLPLNGRDLPYHWRLPPGAEHEVTTSVDPSRSELSWPGHPFPSAGSYELVTNQGKPRFRLEVLGPNVALVSRTAEVQASYWLEVVLSGAEARSPERFSWQRASGGALPSSWKGAPSNRIEIPLGDSVGTEISSDLAYFDSVTGWATTAPVTFRSVTSAESP